LPTAMPWALDAERVLVATRGDKKAREGVTEFALVTEIGRAIAGVRAPDELVLEILTQGAETQ
ncbi:MAG: hypothetical protein JJD97_14090, partial [Gemmatimonadaceae bacterium]|nr:hypothetical protein [Gemmatimonadaceae bacterium]